MIPQSRIDEFIEKWSPATKAEMKNRLATIKQKVKSTAIQAEIKALKTLLA